MIWKAHIYWLCLYFIDVFGQEVFRKELFPEQLLQQQLQFQQSAIQQQFQELQRQFQVNEQNGIIFQSLKTRQELLIEQLEDIQRQMIQLQQQIQNRLSGGNTFLKVVEEKSQLPETQFIDENRVEEPISIKQVDRNDDIVETSCTTGSQEPGICKPLVTCLKFYVEVPELRKQSCLLRPGEFGVCCPNRGRPDDSLNNKKTGILRTPPPPFVAVPSFTPQQITHTIDNALEKINEKNLFASELFSKRVVIESGSAAAWHQELFPTTNETLQIGQAAQKSVEASVSLVNDFNLSPDQGKFGLPKFTLLNTVLADTCPKEAFCEPHKYRSTDGSCNNLQHQQWGAPGTALQRILPPKYGDGVNSPRTHANNGKPLPSSRLVSVSFAQQKDSPSENFTLMLMQWGQLLDHDLTHTPISRGQSGFGISCCRGGKLIAPSLRHPDCFAIELPQDDHMFAKFSERCMEFVRSLPAPRPECNFGPREQMNQITGYMDGSEIYGSSLDTQRGLRSFRGGKLKAQNIRGKELLPANPSECSDQQRGLSCFSAGDGRVNEQIELALMHTVWMREHNRIADILSKGHPNWSDEAVFQETRRIVIAQLQHITYNEYLPIILGQDYVVNAQLLPKNSGWTRLYDANLNGGITNAFATAAFRFGHTMIQDNIHGYGKFGNIRRNLRLSKQHFAPFDLYQESSVDDFLRGLSFQSTQNFDRFFSKEITDHLFQGNLNFGLDLIALNIQRGRDHGLAPYNDWREVCGIGRAKNWQDLESTMDVDSIQQLSLLYESVEEVDLFIGGVAERPLSGAYAGPTFVCIIGDQFSRLRRGDRFFYEEGSQASSFSQAQLNEIRKVSLARILCDNSDNIVMMQPLAFLKPSFLNQRVACNSQAIPTLDLRAWSNETPAIP